MAVETKPATCILLDDNRARNVFSLRRKNNLHRSLSLLSAVQAES
jgi:hypothetical protein